MTRSSVGGALSRTVRSERTLIAESHHEPRLAVYSVGVPVRRLCEVRGVGRSSRPSQRRGCRPCRRDDRGESVFDTGSGQTLPDHDRGPAACLAQGRRVSPADLRTVTTDRGAAPTRRSSCCDREDKIRSFTRNRQCEGRAERPVVDQLQVTPERPSQSSAQGQAEPNPRRGLSGVLCRLGKRPEQAANDPRAQTRTVVSNGHDEPTTCQRSVQMNATIGRTGGVLDGVIHQVRQDLIDYRQIHSQACIAILRTNDEFHSGLLRARGQSGNEAFEDLGEWKRFSPSARVTPFETSKSQHVLDEVTEPVGLGAQRLEVRPLGVRVRDHPFVEHFRIEAKRRQWRTQFVGHRGDERTPALAQCKSPVEHQSDGHGREREARPGDQQ